MIKYYIDRRKGETFKRISSGLMLTLLLIGILGSAFTVQPIKASGTIYIRANGSIDPPTALISTSDNVTYKFIGNIYEPIVVQRSNIIIDGGRTIGLRLQGSGSGTGFDLASVSNVTIKNTNIRSFSYGINLYSSSTYNNMIGNDIRNSGYGIRLYSSLNNNISGNNIVANSNGIELTSSSNNSMSGNSITGNGAGIFLTSSSNSNISRNDIVNNDYGIYLYSLSNNNSISENTITANDLYGIILDRSSNNSISGNTITANNNGIKLGDSSDNVLRTNRMNDNTYNFIVDGSSLSHFLNDIDVSNTVNSKLVYYLLNRQDLAINPSTFPNVGYLALVDSQNMTVENLSFTENGQGILLAYTANSTITKNNITNNYRGIQLQGSSNNSIYHNNLVNNFQQAFVQSDSTNVWNINYPFGGNYWSDYTGVDLYNGAYQSQIGSDGIGDTSYIIDAYNRDNYPLMKPYSGPFDIGITGITPSRITVVQGFSLDITIKIINYGTVAETFNVNVYANTTLIATLTDISLENRSSTTITFAWNTTGFAKGNYTISAVADTVPGETDISDNSFVDGWVFVLSTGHDVAIRNITLTTVLGGRHTSPFNVTAMNVGGYTETFTVSVYVNETEIGSQNVISLESGASKIVTFNWTTAGFALGDYTVSAYAWPVIDETDLSDNRYTDGVATVSKPGDLTLDGVINYQDAFLFRQAYVGAYNHLADFYQDGVINYKDASVFRGYYIAG